MQPPKELPEEDMKLCVMGNHMTSKKFFHTDKKAITGLQSSCIHCYNESRKTLYSTDRLHRYRYDQQPKRHCDVCDVEIFESRYKRHLSGGRHLKNLKKLASGPSK